MHTSIYQISIAILHSIFNAFIVWHVFDLFTVTCGDKVDYMQKKSCNVSVLVEETLQVLERHGGEDAFINIKYMVPTYESCLLN